MFSLPQLSCHPLGGKIEEGSSVDIKDNYSKIDFAISSLFVLEKQLFDCMEYIPFIEENRQTISPKFIPIIMDACSLIDSIFFEMIEHKEKKRFNLRQYSALFESELDLQKNNSLFLISPVRSLAPFRGWTTKQPLWWDAYNDLKHNRLNNYHVATFTNVVMALAGLHQLMACQIEFISGFLKSGCIDTTGDFTKYDLYNAFHTGTKVDTIVESKLFASPTLNNFINSSKNDGSDFELEYYTNGLSHRVANLAWGHDGW
jgi:hypothetical protein